MIKRDTLGVVPGPVSAGTFAVSATFTAEPLGESLSFWIRRLGLNVGIEFVPSNQVFQQLLDPTSLVRTNKGGLNCILMRLDELAGDAQSELPRSCDNFVESVWEAARVCPSPILILHCPSTQLLGPEIDALEDRMQTAFQNVSGVTFVTRAAIAKQYPVPECFDRRGDELLDRDGKIANC